MKKVLCMTLVCAMCFGLLVGCGSSESSSSEDVSEEKVVTLKVGHAAAETTAKHLGWLNFEQLVEEKSQGKIEVEIFPNQQLGSDRELAEAVQLGNLTMCSVSSAPVASFKKEFYALDLPFLFKDRETVYEVLDGPVGKELLGYMEEVNLKGLGYWENGFRNFSNSKVPVRKPKDLEGLKVRTMENEIHIAAWKLLGSNPTPMAFGELFTALQQKTVDGQENPLELIYNTKLHEVQDYITKTQHIYSPYIVMINKEFFENLSPEQQKIIQDAITETTAMQREKAKEKEEEAAAAMKNTVEIIELTAEEKKAFREKMSPVYEEVKKKAGAEIVNKLLEATK